MTLAKFILPLEASLHTFPNVTTVPELGMLHCVYSRSSRANISCPNSITLSLSAAAILAKFAHPTLFSFIFISLNTNRAKLDEEEESTCSNSGFSWASTFPLFVRALYFNGGAGLILTLALEGLCVTVVLVVMGDKKSFPLRPVNETTLGFFGVTVSPMLVILMLRLPRTLVPTLCLILSHWRNGSTPFTVNLSIFFSTA
mmetsp:Transcript_11082/g.16774  ORF Transcript_11082/g.16774 Transcript_11082/m.16774 type:complete len:200 (+) Transcript_11082:1110-1709(+)